LLPNQKPGNDDVKLYRTQVRWASAGLQKIYASSYEEGFLYWEFDRDASNLAKDAVSIMMSLARATQVGEDDP
jgi:hypothetical protein